MQHPTTMLPITADQVTPEQTWYALHRLRSRPRWETLPQAYAALPRHLQSTAAVGAFALRSACCSIMRLRLLQCCDAGAAWLTNAEAWRATFPYTIFPARNWLQALHVATAAAAVFPHHSPCHAALRKALLELHAERGTSDGLSTDQADAAIDAALQQGRDSCATTLLRQWLEAGRVPGVACRDCPLPAAPIREAPRRWLTPEEVAALAADLLHLDTKGAEPNPNPNPEGHAKWTPEAAAAWLREPGRVAALLRAYGRGCGVVTEPSPWHLQQLLQVPAVAWAAWAPVFLRLHGNAWEMAPPAVLQDPGLWDVVPLVEPWTKLRVLPRVALTPARVLPLASLSLGRTVVALRSRLQDGHALPEGLSWWRDAWRHGAPVEGGLGVPAPCGPLEAKEREEQQFGQRLWRALRETRTTPGLAIYVDNEGSFPPVSLASRLDLPLPLGKYRLGRVRDWGWLWVPPRGPRMVHPDMRRLGEDGRSVMPPQVWDARTWSLSLTSDDEAEGEWEVVLALPASTTPYITGGATSLLGDDGGEQGPFMLLLHHDRAAARSRIIQYAGGPIAHVEFLWRNAFYCCSHGETDWGALPQALQCLAPGLSPPDMSPELLLDAVHSILEGCVHSLASWRGDEEEQGEEEEEEEAGRRSDTTDLQDPVEQPLAP